MKLFSCKIKGHKFKKLPTDSLYTEEFECTRCGKQYTTDGYGRMVKLSKYWRNNNSYFETFLKKQQSA